MKTGAAAGLVLAVLFLGCSKNDDGVGNVDYLSQFYGKWQVTNGGDNIRFFIMEPEREWYILGEDQYGFRGIQNGQYDASATAISFGASSFTYIISAGQLTLFNTADTIAAIRNDAAPDQTTWLRSITLLDSIPAPVNQYSDIAFDGVSLWCGNGFSPIQTLYRINTTTRVVGTLPFAGFTPAVEWDGAALWCSGVSGTQILRITPDSGRVLSTSPALGGSIYGIAWDGAYLWCSSQTEDKIIAYDPAANSVVTSVSGVSGEGMAATGGFLYLCKDGLLHRCTPVPFRSLSSYRFPNGILESVAFDGTDFWALVARASTSGFVRKIFKFRLS